jgi:hypothetical protein
MIESTYTRGYLTTNELNAVCAHVENLSKWRFTTYRQLLVDVLGIDTAMSIDTSKFAEVYSNVLREKPDNPTIQYLCHYARPADYYLRVDPKPFGIVMFNLGLVSVYANGITPPKWVWRWWHPLTWVVFGVILFVLVPWYGLHDIPNAVEALASHLGRPRGRGWERVPSRTIRAVLRERRE